MKKICSGCEPPLTLIKKNNMRDYDLYVHEREFFLHFFNTDSNMYPWERGYTSYFGFISIFPVTVLNNVFDNTLLLL